MKILLLITLFLPPFSLAYCPDVAWQLSIPRSYSLCTLDHNILLGGENSLVILDSADPEAIVQVGSLDLPGNVKNMVAKGDTAYCLIEGAGLFIVDVSDPSHPTLLSSYVFDATWGIALYNNALYATKDQETLIFDVSNPANPQLKGSINMYSSPLFLAYPYLFTTYHGTGIYDISQDLFAPKFVSKINDSAAATGYGLFNHTLIIGETDNLKVVDITSPDHPILLSDFPVDCPFVYYACEDYFASKDNTAFLAGAYLMAFDVGDPSMIFPISSIHLSTIVMNATIIDNTLYLLEENSYPMDTYNLEAYTINDCLNLTDLLPGTYFHSPETLEQAQSVGFCDRSAPPGMQLSWDFGDATTASYTYPEDFAHNPSQWHACFQHRFYQTGSYDVTLSAANQFGQRSFTKTITVTQGPHAPSPVDAGPYRYFIPAATHAPGAHGAFWQTDLTLSCNNTNCPYGDEEDAWIYYTERGGDGTTSEGVTIRFTTADRTKEFSDIIANLFGHQESSGSVIVASQVPISVYSRTYTTRDDGGSYGQFIPAVTDSESSFVSGKQSLCCAKIGDQYRTNFGIYNPNDSTINVDIIVGDCISSQTGCPYVNVPPLSSQQVSLGQILQSYGGLPETNPPSLPFTITVDELDLNHVLPYYPYFSIVDNTTGDAVYIPAESLAQ